ncbi:glycosyltransferase family 2 protein [Clostridioides sp. ES-S-0108-01]|uniref:glycosyltransferase family 2 protein n=1 Tax=Clostridioides sp. ES-S-0108-01 TaxID=2770773 RepID=UPI001D0C3D0B|nr:glycosyltransferase family 2 protein [Clostridioides sp. ES-S-0108-01]UDN50431.1 glycosyltransferase family 2 protein [Clostridioides sp. ES-S-0107-01]
MIYIIIPNYNGCKYLRKCINSILKQSYNCFRIIVIDNNSNDDSYEWLKNYENIIFKKLDRNYGFSVAVNEGIKLANSEYIVLLNNDTEVTHDWLKNLVKTINNDERIFSVSSKMVRYNNKNVIDDAGDDYNLIGWTLKRGDGKNIKRFNKNKEIFSSCAGAAIYRKCILEKIGYFDERFFAYMEDLDICYRAKINGYKNVYCSDAVVYHVGSATTGSKYNEFKVKLSARNNIYTIYKNMPLVQLIMNFPFLLIGFFIKHIFFIVKGFGKSYRSGITEGIKSLHKMKKVDFRFKNLFNYLKIEVLLIVNVFRYIVSKFI